MIARQLLRVSRNRDQRSAQRQGHFRRQLAAQLDLPADIRNLRPVRDQASHAQQTAIGGKHPRGHHFDQAALSRRGFMLGLYAGQKHAFAHHGFDPRCQALRRILRHPGKRGLAENCFRIHARRRCDSENALSGLVGLSHQTVGCKEQHTAR